MFNKPALASHNGMTYSYLYNLQGDVIGLVDSAGSLVVEYKYNAWGSIIGRAGSLAETLGKLNPFRYRGYVYDEETWMYWLKSRYYYPEMQRFISADVFLGNTKCILSHNAYAYAKCRPTMRTDAGGSKDVIYSAHDSFVVENDNILHNFIYGTQYYIEASSGVRYKANSFETVSLTAWIALDAEFMENEFDSLIEEAASYASIQSVFKQSIEGELDFKHKLDESKVYLMNGVVYNRNEAGNFMWAYYLKEHGYIDLFQGVLAQGGSLVKKDITNSRFDEPYDRAVRYAGLKYWYQRKQQEWLFRLMYGNLDQP